MLPLIPNIVTTGTASTSSDATRPNFVLFLQDDQDYALGGWTPMRQTTELLGDTGAIAENWFIHTPVCCPSRAQILSGRYFHNVRVPAVSDGGCMHANTSVVNPNSFGAVLGKAGYTLGYFGKHMNQCPHEPPSGWDCPTCGWFANGGGADAEPGGYLNATFSHFMGGVAVGPDEYHDKAGTYRANTNGEHAGYTTSLIANYSIAWLRTVAAGDKPWMVTVAPKACHVAAEPAPWYRRGTYIDALAAPRTPAYNASKEQLAGHHHLIANQDMITPEQGVFIDGLFRDRWRTLLSVDDAVAGVVAAVRSLGAFDSTYFLVTSDHGYNLGQHRLPSCKLNVYDHDIRIPMLIAGPGVRPGAFAHIGSNVDVAPTLLDLAGLPEAADMDGTSIAPLLIDATHAKTPRATAARLFEVAAARRARRNLEQQVEAAPEAADADDADEDADEAYAAAAAEWRDVHLVEYYSLGDVERTGHLVDEASSNTYRALRFVGSATHGDFLYAEFTSLDNWDFADASQFFYEAYDVAKDPDQLDNIYHQLTHDLQKALGAQLAKQWQCKGRSGPHACA
tara:strand:- start:85 stop:1779 length:1695 start_codon:yes stop_codon:yes gene_type:complete